MKTIQEHGDLVVRKCSGFIEADYIVPRERVRRPTAVVRDFFRSAVKNIPDFDTWKDPLVEKVSKKIKGVSFDTCNSKKVEEQYFIYGFFMYAYSLEWLLNESGVVCWKLHVSIATE